MLYHKGTLCLETERLILRRFRMSDAERMYINWANDSNVTKYLSWPAHSDIGVTKKVLSKWIPTYEDSQYYQWAIELKSIEEPIGSIALVRIDNAIEMCEIGYCIGKSFWNKGILTEALKAVIQFCFMEVSFNRLMARHHLGNAASGRVMEKCGLKYEGLLRQVMRNNKGELVDCKYYSILKEEYNE